MTEIHEGGCNCGAVRYKTLAAPKRVGACACSWCQKRTGSAFGISVYFLKDDVEINGGPLRTYRAWSDTGRWLDSEFCETCGTTVTWTLQLFPDFRGIAGGCFDRPTFWYELERFVFARTKPDWLQLPEGLEVHEAMPK